MSFDLDEMNIIRYEGEKLLDRLDGLRQDIFNEIGRLTYHLENYAMQDSTKKSHAATIAVLRNLLQRDDDRA